jgi:phospholipid/cholesterol/gamma-HCH transport system substrate-binding protein/paraquat-inducible protein B
MNDEVRYYRLGLFLLAGTALAITALLVFGSGVLGRSGPILETYLDESVQGLDVGASLKYRGVRIGKVEQIGFAEGLYTMEGDADELRNLGRLVVVRARLDRSFAEGAGTENYSEQMKRLVDAGLRVRVAAQGLTGTSYLEADYLDPVRYPPMKIPWQPDYVYVPSAPSSIAQLRTGAEQVVERIGKLDIESVILHLDESLVAITKAVEDAKVGKLSGEATSLLSDLRVTNQRLRAQVETIDLRPAQDRLVSALDQLSTTLRRIDSLVAGEQGNVAELVDSLRVSADNLRELSENARAYPSLLLFGEAPPRRIPEKQ